MTIEVLELLLTRGSHRNLVVQPELRSGTKLAEVLHRRAEDGNVRGVRLSPAFQRFQTPPPAQPKRLLNRLASVIDHRHISIGETSDLPTFVSKEIHPGAQH